MGYLKTKGLGSGLYGAQEDGASTLVGQLQSYVPKKIKQIQNKCTYLLTTMYIVVNNLRNNNIRIYDIWFRYVFHLNLRILWMFATWSDPNHAKNQCQRTVASFTTHLGTSWPSRAINGSQAAMAFSIRLFVKATRIYAAIYYIVWNYTLWYSNSILIRYAAICLYSISWCNIWRIYGYTGIIPVFVSGWVRNIIKSCLAASPAFVINQHNMLNIAQLLHLTNPPWIIDCSGSQVLGNVGPPSRSSARCVFSSWSIAALSWFPTDGHTSYLWINKSTAKPKKQNGTLHSNVQT